MLVDRKKLKGKKVSVAEDLTPANAKLAKDADKHSSTIASFEDRVQARSRGGR